MNRLVFIFLIAPVLSSCRKEATEVSTPFRLTETVAKDKQLARAELKPVVNELLLNGKITLDEDKVARVFPLAGGFVKELFVELGDYVKKGQVLAIIRSPEIAGFTREGIAAEAQLGIAEKNALVAEQLFNTGDISEVELINARKELETARGEVERTRAVLDMYGAGAQAIYPIKSPVSGVIVQKNIALNMELRTEDISPVFVVGNLDEVWVMANVYESDIPKVHVGYEADVTTTAYPERVFRGKIDKVFSIIDAHTKVLRARVTLPNHNFMLKPEMFANVRIHFTEPGEKVAVPSAAIIFDKSRYFVMVYQSDSNIETREVKLHLQHDGITYLASGLQPNEQVMTKYQLLVYDALND